MNDQLPPGTVLTGTSPEFSADDLPPALAREHRTADGVYGLLCVKAGTLDYVRAADPDAPVALAAGDRHVIPPGEVHRVVLGAGARFCVEFHRLGGDACS